MSNLSTLVLIPVHAQQRLRQQESKILATAALSEHKTDRSIAAQFIAYSHAGDLYDIHDVYHNHFRSKPGAESKATSHCLLKQKAEQLQLLALQSLETLLKP